LSILTILTQVDNVNPKFAATGVDMGDGAKADLYSFDTHTSTWSSAEVEGPVPPSRSYHTACACGDYMFVFGGCGESGDMW